MRLASRGQRDLDGPTETIQDPGLAGQLRSRGRKIHIQALLAGLALTGLALLPAV